MIFCVYAGTICAVYSSPDFVSNGPRTVSVEPNLIQVSERGHSVKFTLNIVVNMPYINENLMYIFHYFLCVRAPSVRLVQAIGLSLYLVGR